ncbi:MAG: hypothetical protein CL916_01485 [Deltaproteobacteria bacterium]|nr:hypothetical protein [Deltaproteobacteria bacterium]
MYPRPILKKAKMVLIDSSSPDVKLSNATLSKKKIQFQFNPKELSLNRSVSVNPGDREPDSYYSPIKVDGKSTYDELSFELTLDQSASSMAVTAGTFFLPVTKAEVPLTLMPNTFLPSLGVPNVKDSVMLLYAWTMIVDPSKIEKNRPYFVRFEWNKFKFSGVISKLDIKYTMFDSDGTPLRAKVDVTIKGRLGEASVEDLAGKVENTKTTSI